MPLPRLHALIAALLLTALLPGFGGLTRASAADFTEEFDGPKPSWTVRTNPALVKIESQQRHQHILKSGEASEVIAAVAGVRGGAMQLEHQLPPAVVIDDLKLTLAVRSNRPGLSLFLRVVLPHEVDPETKSPVTAWVRGDEYNELNRWQTLSVQTTDKRIREQVTLLRARLKRPLLDTRDVFADRAVLIAHLPQGAAEIFIDELRLGPIVNPQSDAAVVQTAHEDRYAEPEAEFLLDRLLVDGNPFFPRVAPFHGEDPDVVAKTGVNVSWIPRYNDYELLEQLRERGLRAIAKPPRAVSPTGEVLDAAQAGILPFSPRTAPILAWYMGTQFDAADKDDLVAWASQVRTADREARRPLMGDVAGRHRVYSRHLEMLGLSRHVLNGSYSVLQQKDWLLEKRRSAQGGRFLWSWIQTEPTDADSRWRSDLGRRPIVVEPEQIRLQVYSALAAGCRGLGYWTTTPLDADYPGAEERRLQITQLNYELELLEPWLAAGTLMDRIPFTINRPSKNAIGRSQLDFRNTAPDAGERDALLTERKFAAERNRKIEQELEAAVIRSDRYGMLVLPVWTEHNAEYVPGQAAANDVEIVLPGAPRSASVWEVGSTSIRSLSREHAAGGIRIRIPRFDQTAAIVVTVDRRLITSMQARMNEMMLESARISVDLARAKLERVTDVNQELESLGVGLPDGPQILAAARAKLDQASAAFKRRDYHGARTRSAETMQLLRILQRSHWERAVDKLSSPAAGPYTVCFQTLPDHWKLVTRIGRASTTTESKLLPSGDFEDYDELVSKWWFDQNAVEGAVANMELHPNAKQGQYALRLAAVPETGRRPPRDVARPPILLTTPPMRVKAGQIVHVAGWIRLPSSIVGGEDGVVLYDSLAGRSGALRWHEAQGWRRFELLRESSKTQTFTITLALHGLGEVYLDDLHVTALTPAYKAAAAVPASREKFAEEPSSRSRAFEFLNGLPKRIPGFRGNSGTP